MPDNTEDWDGTERRRDFDEQVASTAIWIAAQQDVQATHKRDVDRAASRAGWRAFFVSLVILLPCTIYIGYVLNNNAQADSRANCQTQADGRPIGNARNFVSIELLQTADQAFAQFPKAFQTAEIARINTDLQALRQSTLTDGSVVNLMPAGTPGQVTSFSDLVTFLKYLPPITCAKLVS